MAKVLVGQYPWPWAKSDSLKRGKIGLGIELGIELDEPWGFIKPTS
jgi:hypothetical protein